jgi:hypothetical protein
MGRRILSGVVRRCADVDVHIAGLVQTAAAGPVYYAGRGGRCGISLMGCGVKTGCRLQLRGCSFHIHTDGRDVGPT